MECMKCPRMKDNAILIDSCKNCHYYDKQTEECHYRKLYNPLYWRSSKSFRHHMSEEA